MGEKGMSTNCDINPLFICMALQVTFPWSVHRTLATTIQNDEKAERRDTAAEHYIRKELGIRGQ